MRQFLPIGIVLALLSAVLFGVSTPLAKMMLGHVNPWMMAGLLYLGAGIGLGVIHVSRGLLAFPITEARLGRADLPWLTAVIMAGGVLGPIFLMFGLTHTDPAAAALLLNLEGLATMAIAWLAFHESVDRRLLFGALAILAGAAVLTWQGRASLNGGAVLIVMACTAWGIDNNLTRKLSAADPVQIAMLKGLVAGAINVLLAWMSGAAFPDLGIILTAGVLGFFGYGISLALFVLALRYLGTARTGAYFSLAPFIGAVLSLALFAEPLTIQLLLAGGLMAVGLWLHLTESHEHEHLHEVSEHEHQHVHDVHHQHKHGQNDAAVEPHNHKHRHQRLRHRHPHYPDIHHRHGHEHA